MTNPKGQAWQCSNRQRNWLRSSDVEEYAKDDWLMGLCHIDKLEIAVNLLKILLLIDIEYYYSHCHSQRWGSIGWWSHENILEQKEIPSALLFAYGRFCKKYVYDFLMIDFVGNGIKFALYAINSRLKDWKKTLDVVGWRYKTGSMFWVWDKFFKQFKEDNEKETCFAGHSDRLTIPFGMSYKTSKPLLNPKRTVENVGAPEFWSNRMTLILMEKAAKGKIGGASNVTRCQPKRHQLSLSSMRNWAPIQGKVGGLLLMCHCCIPVNTVCSGMQGANREHGIVQRRAAEEEWKVKSIPNAKTNASKLATATLMVMEWA
ncbi:hypothetical protein CK203_096456 [Vitis vinifera]|uniref:Uncharacterized protein n=1 Tax=Vitis vinifera TaxID=29760 RepID=A0A438BWW9_VITVI|nr:hypothetical protein CK203_096456 [Vitis vinifera]